MHYPPIFVLEWYCQCIAGMLVRDTALKDVNLFCKKTGQETKNISSQETGSEFGKVL